MTGKAEFSEDEWQLVLSAPPLAGLMVVTAARGGAFRETLALGKAYGEALQQHGASQLLDEITGAKPKLDHTRFGSPDELNQHALSKLADAVQLLERKAAPDEVEDYRRFVLALADKVANAHREDDVAVNPDEQAAIGQVRSALGGAGTTTGSVEQADHAP
jgi:hypothetical protein